jgi:hypothetical protein
VTPGEWKREVSRLAAEHGYKVNRSKSGHLRLTKPGRPMLFTSCTSSDWRAMENLRHKILRNEKAA